MSFFVGLLKEYFDVKIIRSYVEILDITDIDIVDIIYTVLGGVTGTTIFLLKTYIKKKKYNS